MVIWWVVGLLGGSSNLKFCANLFEGFIQSKVKANKEGAVVVVVAVVSFLGGRKSFVAGDRFVVVVLAMWFV